MPDPTAWRWPTADAAFADACREFIKGCTCASASQPWECRECTETFARAVVHRAIAYGLQIGANSIHESDA
jgi:hypothetical protein